MLQVIGQNGHNALPNWVPEAAQLYLLHTETGHSIRALARGAGCHASTVLRQVRRFENRRDDPLIDEALRRLGAAHFRGTSCPDEKDQNSMTAQFKPSDLATDDDTINQEGRRILRRLCETGSVLAVAADMEKAVVMRTAPDGSCTRTAVVDRTIAQAMALKEWIVCNKAGRISQYEITTVGRNALKRLMEESEDAGDDDDQPYADQHREWGEKSVAGHAERIRYNMAESPLAGLARRKDKNGQPFLSEDLVAAGERLREDFELAQMGPRVAQNWDKFLTGGDRGGFKPGSSIGNGPADARDRVAEALHDLGPGLGDVVLRTCCFLEGMETTEKRMGWSARSGKIVLRIALQRLQRHYEERYGPYGPMIG
ncbi:DUF6456 domain-containing protein [Pseudaestuariivita rosea]|uniref:DUF6456 domain-containing protein n=1 Tax=Pseudaestuariivita rosea TaxID=2763263 RepID=UPI001ABAFC95|nr:DUF6456 domain-containing protein [Pseudaestuariivita rosea]